MKNRKKSLWSCGCSIWIEVLNPCPKSGLQQGQIFYGINNFLMFQSARGFRHNPERCKSYCRFVCWKRVKLSILKSNFTSSGIFSFRSSLLWAPFARPSPLFGRTSRESIWFRFNFITSSEQILLLQAHFPKWPKVRSTYYKVPYLSHECYCIDRTALRAEIRENVVTGVCCY